MKLKIIQLLALLCLFLVTGVFWGTWLALAKSMDAFTVEEYLHIGKVIISNLSTTMRILGPLCLGLIIIALHLIPKKKSVSFYLGITSLFLLIAALVITVMILVPIDHEIRTAPGLPDTTFWQDVRIRWKYYHTLRTFLGLTSFAAFASSVIWTPRPSAGQAGFYTDTSTMGTK